MTGRRGFGTRDRSKRPAHRHLLLVGYLDERYDWNRMDVLQQLAVGSEEAVKYIADLLDRMRIAIEPIVEQEIV